MIILNYSQIHNYFYWNVVNSVSVVNSNKDSQKKVINIPKRKQAKKKRLRNNIAQSNSLTKCETNVGVKVK